MASEHQVPTAALIEGLERARERLRAQLPGEREAFHAAFEALAWAGAIRDRLMEDRVAVPAVIEGLYYMRNVVLHQGADVLSWLLIPGSSAEIGRAVIGRVRLDAAEDVKAWHWPSEGGFVPPRSTAGQDEYRMLLAEVDVEVTFSDAIDQLRRLGYGH